MQHESEKKFFLLSAKMVEVKVQAPELELWSEEASGPSHHHSWKAPSRAPEMVLRYHTERRVLPELKFGSRAEAKATQAGHCQVDCMHAACREFVDPSLVVKQRKTPIESFKIAKHQTVDKSVPTDDRQIILQQSARGQVPSSNVA